MRNAIVFRALKTCTLTQNQSNFPDFLDTMVNGQNDECNITKIKTNNNKNDLREFTLFGLID